MPSPLAEAHIEAEARLRAAVEGAVAATWEGLPGHDRANVDEWLSRVVPAVATAQRASVAVTEAYLAQVLGRAPIGVDPQALIGAAVRNGAAPATVYERPFITLWGGLGSGLDFEAASRKALERATSAAAMDVQLSMRATAAAVGEADPGIFGYARAADAGACEFCREVDGAYVKSADAMPLHNRCGCGLEPMTKPHRGAVLLPDGRRVEEYSYGRLVEVHDHGELGPVLTAPGDHFTTESEIH